MNNTELLDGTEFVEGEILYCGLCGSDNIAEITYETAEGVYTVLKCLTCGELV